MLTRFLDKLAALIVDPCGNHARRMRLLAAELELLKLRGGLEAARRQSVEAHRMLLSVSR